MDGNVNMLWFSYSVVMVAFLLFNEVMGSLRTFGEASYEREREREKGSSGHFSKLRLNFIKSCSRLFHNLLTLKYTCT